MSRVHGLRFRSQSRVYRVNDNRQGIIVQPPNSVFLREPCSGGLIGKSGKFIVQGFRGFGFRGNCSYVPGSDSAVACVSSLASRLGSNMLVSPRRPLRLMDKILHYPLEGIYHNSHSLGSLGSCRMLYINSIVHRKALPAIFMKVVQHPKL